MNLPILMYHSILDRPIPGSDLAVAQTDFRAQVSYLRKAKYQSLTLTELADGVRRGKTSPLRPVVFTFDDALESVYTQAFPILQENGFTATVFVVSQAVGRHNFWDDGKGLPRLACLNAEQLRHLHEAGWEIGSHGASHANLVGVSSEILTREVVESKSALEKIIRTPIRSFGYPFGAQDMASREAVRRAGYTAACAIAPGTTAVTADLFALRRVYVKPTDTLAAFRRKISSWYLRYRAWRKR